MRTTNKHDYLRRKWTTGLAAVIVLALAVTACRQENKTKETKGQPNIVLIVADDLGFGDVGCYGATRIRTPNIDRLATEGISFTNAYTASSLCSPSRYSIMTGRYSWRTRLKFGVLKYFEKPLIEEDRLTLPKMLRSHGYYTACIGKWHLGLDWTLKENAPEDAEESVFNSWDVHGMDYIDFSKPVKGGPVERGFDYFFGMAGSNNMLPYVFIENDAVTQAPSEEQKAYDHYDKALKAPNWDIRTVNQVLTRKAVKVINDHFSKRNGEPLFLYFPTSAIHRPCLPTFTKGSSEAGLRGDIVVELDWTVSEIVKALKENGAYDNTLLIFTSDNGPRPGDPALWMNRYAEGDYEDFHQDYFDEYQPEYINEHGNQIWKNGWYTYGHRAAGPYLGFKSDAWDGGFRVPFIVRWPGEVQKGAVSKDMICLSDLMATFADLIGQPLQENEGEDSYSFLSNIRDPGAAESRRSMTLTGGASGAFVEIAGKWKYIEAAVPGRWPETYYPDGPSKLDPQLYNLERDSSEQQNLYNKEGDRVTNLKDVIKKVEASPKSEGANNKPE